MEIRRPGSELPGVQPSKAGAPFDLPQNSGEALRQIDTVDIAGKGSAARFIDNVKDRVLVKGEYASPPYRYSTDDIKGLGVGTALYLGYELGGIGTFIHESAHKAMIEAMYTNSGVTIQIDSFDNVKNLALEPSLQNLGRVLTMYDANQDKAAGVTRYTYGDGLTETGEKYTDNQRQALISAAGSLSTEIPALAGFAIGFGMRKKHPAIGYTMMAMSGAMHVTNSAYVIDAMLPGPKQPGHDWAKFAQATGVPAALTAAVFALSMPAIGLGMYLLEKRGEDRHKDMEALSIMIATNDISKARLNALMADYKDHEKIEGLEEKMEKLLQTPVEKVDEGFKKEFRKLSKDLVKEYERFSDHLMEEFRPEIDETKNRLDARAKRGSSSILGEIGKDVKSSFQQDKVGTTLKGAGLAGGVAVAGKSLAQAAEALGAVTLPAATGLTAKAFSAVIPGLGILGAAGTAYQAGKVLQNPHAGKIDKTAAVSQAVFAAVGAASLAIPGIGLPLALVSIGGTLATFAGRWIAHKIAD